MLFGGFQRVTVLNESVRRSRREREKEKKNFLVKMKAKAIVRNGLWLLTLFVCACTLLYIPVESSLVTDYSAASVCVCAVWKFR